MVKFINVSKRYLNGVFVFININLIIEKGEFVFLVGLSGVGKFIIVKFFLKEIDLIEGEIIVGDYKFNEFFKKEIFYYRRKIGIVF